MASAPQQIALAQQPWADTLVELYSLDCSMLVNAAGQAGAVYNWSTGPIGGAPMTLAGVAYAPMPIQGTDFEWNGRGTLPTPKIIVSNVSGLAAAIVIGFGDALGAKLTRTRTFSMFLDGQSRADSSALFEPDIFRVQRKSKHTATMIEWELSASIDLNGVRLPRRQVIRNTCTHTYRTRNVAAGAWVYGSCPYTGAAQYDVNGTAVGDYISDVCGKRLSDCIKRFPTPTNGTRTPLPTRAFPGVAISGV